MDSKVIKLNLENLLKENKINEIKDFYKLELDFNLDIIEKIISNEKREFIEKKIIMYMIDERFKQTLNNYSFEAPIKTKEVLGKYFEEMEKNKLKQSYKLEKENDFENKIKKLQNGVVSNNGEEIKACYIQNKLIAYIKVKEVNEEIIILDLYSRIKGEGLGTKLINSLDKEKRISCSILPNSTIKIFFEKLGFENDKENNNKMIKKTKFTKKK